MEKVYIVSLNKGVDYNSFWTDMESPTNAHPFVPDRRVDIVDNRDGSTRICYYSLTDEEAVILREDPRVYAVEEPTKAQKFTLATQTTPFDKTTSTSGNYVNWGLRRSNSSNNDYGTSTTAPGGYNYTLDGTGVDVVIQDSGLQIDHPEFQDAQGNSRVVAHDWYQVSGLPGTMPAGHYQDTDGHGTHVAGIAAGKTYGWAKNAKVYSVKVAGLDGGEGGGISDPDCFDVIKLWHRNKPIDPATGQKRPTIVNMSWGYGDYYTNINGGVYRGTPWAGTSIRTDYGMTPGGNNRHPIRVGYIDVALDELIDEGVLVCIAAGNAYHKIDVPGGNDYDNYYVGGYFNGAGNNNYYHRGSSPYSLDAVMVGCADTTTTLDGIDQKSVFSETGPGVTVFAPGSDVMSSTSNVNRFGGASYAYHTSNQVQPKINLGDGMATRVVGSNSYVTFDTLTNTFTNFPALANSLQIGARDAQGDGIYIGAENNNKSYRIRYIGQSKYNDPTTVIRWELTFFDNNWMELLVLQHDDATNYSNWAFKDASASDVTNGAMAAHFATLDLVSSNATPRSMVFTTNDGVTWATHPNHRVVLNGNFYSLDATVPTEKGVLNLISQLPGEPDANIDDGVTTYGTPFNFYTFLKSVSNPYKQCNISGTSMASPQVCGLGALFLQLNPQATPADFSAWVIRNSVPALYSTGLDNDYTNSRSIKGAFNRYLYNPFNLAGDTVQSGPLVVESTVVNRS